MYQGQSIRCTRLADDIAELCFDRQDASVNKFDHQTLEELAAAELAGRRGSRKRVAGGRK